jgi:hypothetical protein
MIMERLLNPNIKSTDPDQLQFCLKISDTEFWYCQPNLYHHDLLPDANTLASRIYNKYCGYPNELLRAAQTDNDVRNFVINRRLWMEGEIDVNDFSREEQEELLDDYGYKWSEFTNDAERNQIICENHFEQYPLDYRNDI